MQPRGWSLGRGAVPLLMLVLAGALSSATSAGAFVGTKTETFLPGGARTELKVPGGVTQVKVSAVGASGQPGGGCLSASGGAGGLGAALTATLMVSQGETLHAQFGGGGGATGYCHPGGRGGDASELLSSSLSPLVVAGGGGGGGAAYNDEFAEGGSGGSAQAGSLAGRDGGEGEDVNETPGGGGGEGGGLTSPGRGGSADSHDGCEPGLPGDGGTGGSGGGSGVGIEDDGEPECEGGGGGGGGYRGGGGGGSGEIAGGGGGAGSSYIDTSAAKGSVAVNATSAPQAIVISYMYTGAGCTGNSGTVKLSPGLTDDPVFQSVQIKGTLTGCTGEAFTEASYSATLTTTSRVACPALTGSGTAAFGSTKFAWEPKVKTTTGTSSTALTETAGSAFSDELETGPYGPATLSGTLAQTYTGAATCGVPQGKHMIVKAVTKGTFTGSPVTFE
jgi:hypothetical protein